MNVRPAKPASHNPAIPPQQEQVLVAELGNRFDFEGFGVLLRLCFSKDRINELASRDWPAQRIARSCLEAATAEGRLPSFLWLAVEARRAEPGFRALVLQIVPEVAKVPRPETRAAVRAIVVELDKTRDVLAEAGPRAAAARSRQSFATLAENVTVLEAYKVMHDALHQIQVRQGSTDLLQAARGFTGDPALAEALAIFQDQVRTQHTAAMSWLGGKLPPTHPDRLQAETWLKKLEIEAQKLQVALDPPGDPPAAKLAVGVISKILETVPTQLNGKIFSTVAGLPLWELVIALEEINQATSQPKPELVTTTNALKGLNAILVGEVEEHSRWQSVDDDLWTLDSVFLLPPKDLVADFLGVWPRTTPAVLALTKGRNPTVEQRIVTTIARVNDELTVLEGLLGAPGPLQAIEPARIERLSRLYREYKRELRFVFFSVDAGLRRDCSELVAIARPLQSLLQEIDR